MAKDEHTGRKLAIGALLAGAVGYITGLLTAPKSGQETREDIADKAEALKENAEEQLQRAHDELNDLIKTAKSKTLALGSKARVEFNEAVVRAKDAQNKASHVLKAIKTGNADDPQLNRALKQAKAAKKNLAKYFKS
ncbi:YtxH domain-containing protein [Candidatus Saccharibacteria bacterium]|nr:YtxH domain-containing protein [Candidatus Saccharibacteria bacterium]